jgi:hypothetical protein
MFSMKRTYLIFLMIFLRYYIFRPNILILLTKKYSDDDLADQIYH